MGKRVFSGTNKFILGVFIIVSLASCQKTNEAGDTQNPIINVISTTPHLSSVEICGAVSPFTLKISTQQSITLNIKLTDDIELSEMKIDIHHNFDCHTHKSLQNQVVWNLVEIVQLEGKEMEITKILTPPNNVKPGNYHLTLFCVDMQGKEANRIHYDIVIYDPTDNQSPQITIKTPTEDETFSQNSNISISGVVADDQKMGGGFVEISISNQAQMEFSISKINIPSSIEESFEFNVNYTLPPFFQAGNYQIKVKSADWKNNQSFGNQNIKIAP